MDKTAIKNFAVRARRNLIEQVTQKAYGLGIEKDKIHGIEEFTGGFQVKERENGEWFKKYEKEQRDKLIKNIRTKGFDQAMEEVAYTWFNRFIALRFMEVNGYLPTGVRVLSSTEAGKAEPDIIREALNVDLDVDRDIIFELQDSNDTEDLYKYLLIKQCNQLGKIMPSVFEEIADYTELLLPDNLLAEGSVVRDLVESIEEYDWKIDLSEAEQELEEEKGDHGIEIIGWLYQYYISEKKDEVFAGLKKNIKITKENIPAATQLFTPKWIVKYMVENSLGRLWLESHPDEELKAKWKYYLEEAEQEPEVQKQLDELKNPDLSPEEIKVLDPAMGSGHILVYAFDVLYEIYLSMGYSERDIPNLILEKNLYGLDIDDRAGQLACFALLMKARSKNRRLFRNRPKLNLCSIQESNGIPKEAIEHLAYPDESEIEKYVHRNHAEYLVNVFHDAKEYGSILDMAEINFDAIEQRVGVLRDDSPTDLLEYKYTEVILGNMPPLIQQGRIMSQKYDVVCTNPPYMGKQNMNVKLKDYVNINFKVSAADLYTVFIDRSNNFLKRNGLLGMITQQGFMFSITQKRMRHKILKETKIRNLIQLGPHAFLDISGEKVNTVMFVLEKEMDIRKSESYIGSYIRLVNYKNPRLKQEKFLESTKNNSLNTYYLKQKKFDDIKNYPLIFWIGDKTREILKKNISLDQVADFKSGFSTGAKEKFIYFHWEISKESTLLNIKPCVCGGDNIRYYGNLEHVINLDIEKMKTYKGARIYGLDYFYKEGITVSLLGTKGFCVRYLPKGYVIERSSNNIYVEKDMILYMIGLLNSSFTNYIMKLLNPLLGFQINDIKRLPFIKPLASLKKLVSNLSEKNITISKVHYDSFETSRDFKYHPLLNYPAFKNEFDANKIEIALRRWEDFTNEQFEQLKYNEKELNRIFIEIYRLQDELTPEVEDKDITISKADRERDIKSFISYAVGCMFGRYSLNEEGLIYAGGDFSDKYKLANNKNWEINTAEGWKQSSINIAKDNVIPIADGDYFEDDILERFVDFVKVSFSEETLEENLDYIAETLGKKTNETSRQVIRRYFLKDFYIDHVRTYKKRPIYWLFDSGKQNGFKALIYMHRYDSYTVARVRTDYLHKLQKSYEAEISHLDILIDSNISTREKAAARKRREVVIKQIQECRIYDQAIAHVANQKIEMDLDEGVVVNYAKFQGVEIPQGEGKKLLKADLLAKI